MQPRDDRTALSALPAPLRGVSADTSAFPCKHDTAPCTRTRSASAEVPGVPGESAPRTDKAESICFRSESSSLHGAAASSLELGLPPSPSGVASAVPAISSFLGSSGLAAVRCSKGCNFCICTGSSRKRSISSKIAERTCKMSAELDNSIAGKGVSNNFGGPSSFGLLEQSMYKFSNVLGIAMKAATKPTSLHLFGKTILKVVSLQGR
mmetsp:Transcript_22538/g.56815  ORF Transcript_22538/g.56815 Transcript_22538/m.56815 type:complete len:208 (-) Transcript_22538:23-646(-)